MWLLKLAWKNIWRNRSRTGVTISSIFFAVILSVVTVSLQNGVFGNFVNNLVSFYSGYLQVHKSGYWDNQILDNCMTNDEVTAQLLTSNNAVTAIAPRIESFALLSAGELTRGCLVVGISPGAEAKITSLQKKISMGTYLKYDDNRVLVAEGLAHKLQLNVTDTVYLISQGYHGALAANKYLVGGIVKFGSPELNDQLLYMTLSNAQEFFSASGMITAYVLSISAADNLEKTASHIQREIGNGLEVKTWKEMMPEVDQHITTDKASMVVIQGILYILICFGIFGTLLMMMAERKYEMGMLIAIGMKKQKLIVTIILEQLFVVLVGCIAGLVISAPIVWYLREFPIRLYGEMADFMLSYGFEPVFPAELNVGIFLKQTLVVILLGLALSMYPLFVIIRINPVNAMKK